MNSKNPSLFEQASIFFNYFLRNIFLIIMVLNKVVVSYPNELLSKAHPSIEKSA
jgi:hypothetical protein